MNTQNYTQKTVEAIQNAQNIARENDNQSLVPEHLLYSLLDQDGGLIPSLFKKWALTATPFSASLIPIFQLSPRFPAARCIFPRRPTALSVPPKRRRRA